MRSLKTTALAAAATLITLTAPLSAQVSDYREIKNPPLRQVQVPKPTRIALPNGMIVFLMEDHELPLIRGSARIRGGARDVPADKAGMVGILSQAWRTGGTKTRTGDQLDELLESRAARVETSGGGDSVTVSMDTLKQDFDFVFPIFVDVLRNPEFRQDKIDLAKTQTRTGIARRNDDPQGILGREAARLGYGADSPYTRQAEYATLDAITRDDLLAFHKKSVQPNNIILGFVGDFDSKKVEQQIRATFGSWPKGPAAPKAPAAGSSAKPGIYSVAKDDVTQGNIAILHGGGPLRSSPDYAALSVMNEILSGGFSGRLMQKLRSERGLTYGVGGGVGSEWDYPGLFRITMATKSGTTVESVIALREQVDELVKGSIKPEELELSKDSILNAYVFQADSRGKLLNQAMQLEFYGYPADWYQRYPTLIEKVTVADVERVARQYVHPDQLVVLVVGNEKDFDKPLSSVGQVTPIDITIPEPGAPKSAAPTGGAAAAAPGDTAAGKAAAQKVLAFMGGKAKIDSLTGTRSTASMTMKTPQGDMQAELSGLTRYPDAQRVEMKLPMGEMTTVVSPDAAYVISPMGTQDLPSSQRDSALADLKTDPVHVLKNIDNPKYTFAATGTEKIGDVDAQVIEVNADGATFKWLVDPSTGRLVRKIARARAPMTGEQITEYADWKNFDGLMQPTSAKIFRAGEQVGSMTISTIELNPTIDPTLFKKPTP